MKRMVFVVGAGASKEFGGNHAMPVGSELAIRIERILQEELDAHHRGPIRAIGSAFARSGGFTDSHISAMKRIRDGILSKDSIDEFTEEWREYPNLASVAKYSIAAIILRAERSTVLGQISEGGGNASEMLRSIRDSWLGIAYRKLNPTLSRRDAAGIFSDVSFITFNYDRCIEQFLYYTFTNTIGMSPDVAGDIIKNISIHHVYGSLGELPLPSGGIPFGASDEFIGRSASDIRTFTEEMNSKYLGQIRQIISNAESIIFLGAAYHRQNLEILFGKSPPNEAKIWGTSMGLRPRKLSEINEYFARREGASYFHADTCSGFLNLFEDDIF